VPYDPTIYLGSAAHYRYGRTAYSPGSKPSWRSRPAWTGAAGSWMSAAALACLLSDFAWDVRVLLASRSAEGIFWDWPGDTEVV
jgi:hypothetical protein